ncbi:E3 ubiquitin-protein ligase [Nymphaea thermarum]|nr:E3 ubiquitin-protein ligase [Nymphaea thermarum]
MAVQAQHPSNFWLPDFTNRNGQEKELLGAAVGSDYAFQTPDDNYISHLGSSIPHSNSAMAFLQPPQAQHQQQYHQQQESPCMINLEDLRLPAASAKPPISTSSSPVFTGLRLSLEDQQNQTSPSLIANDLSLLLNQHQQEINHLIRVQSDQLRQNLIRKRQKQYGAIVSAVERIATRKLREKETERERVSRRNAELEEKVEQLRAEARFWQAAARAQEAAAATLQARLASAEAMPSRAGEEPDDAESCNFEPVLGPMGPCRECRRKEASVVVLPCRHLCVCCLCARSLTHCPLCGNVRTACIEAFFS